MTRRRQTLLAAAAIVAAGLAAYANSFNGVYICDDIPGIVQNDTIRKVWPDSFNPPIDTTAGGRPFLNVSFALNYAVGGTDRFGYHAVNLAIHLCCALLIFALVRRTLASPGLKDRFGGTSLAIAAATALIWVVHPVQTQAVTYIIQRCESLAALFYLLTIYCGIRGIESSRLPWYIASAAACAIGATDKETVVSAPLVMLAYDWLFVPGTLRSKLRSRWWFYLALAASWAVLCALLTAYPMSGRHAEELPSALQYALWQPWVIVHYLKLAFWPDPLLLLYRTVWPLATWQIAVGFAVIVPLLAITAWGLVRRRPEAFLGVWFFGILAPTSSLYPLVDVIMDHRMYLPLAAVIVLAAIVLWRLARKAAPRASRLLCGGLLAICVIALGTTAIARNTLYGDAVRFWEQNLRHTPNSPNVCMGLAYALGDAKRYDEAIVYYRRVLDPNRPFLNAYINLAMCLTHVDRPQEAVQYLEMATKMSPESADAARRLGEALEKLGRLDDALVQYNRAITLNPRDYACFNKMGRILLQQGRQVEAAECFRRGLEASPQAPESRDGREAHTESSMGCALIDAGRIQEAIPYFERAVKLSPDYAQAHSNLGSALAAAGRVPEAIPHFERAVELSPDYAQAQNNWGLALAGAGRTQEAIPHFERAVKLKPDYPEAHNNLGCALVLVGRAPEAIPHFERALQLKPDYPQARDNLARIRSSHKKN